MCAGQFLSRGFVALLRKSNPQSHDLKTAVVLGVMKMIRRSMLRQKIYVVMLIGVTLYFYSSGVRQLIIHSNYWPASSGEIDVTGIIYSTVAAIFVTFFLYWPLSLLVKSMGPQKWRASLLWLCLFLAANLSILVFFRILPAII